MGARHYNLIRTKMPCSIVVNDDMYIYADYHTTTKHEVALKIVNETWEMEECKEHTVVADTDGGCDRTEETYYSHTLRMENAIFEDGEIVGFYYDYEFYNGYSSKPNAHVFMFDDPSSLCHYNQRSTWKLIRK